MEYRPHTQQKAAKEFFLMLGILAGLVVLIGGSIFVLWKRDSLPHLTTPPPRQTPSGAKSQGTAGSKTAKKKSEYEKRVEQQLRELKRLRAQAEKGNTAPPPASQTQPVPPRQRKPMSQDEVQRQLQELDALRQKALQKQRQ